jgi:hypothetical protein
MFNVEGLEGQGSPRSKDPNNHCRFLQLVFKDKTAVMNALHLVHFPRDEEEVPIGVGCYSHLESCWIVHVLTWEYIKDGEPFLGKLLDKSGSFFLHILVVVLEDSYLLLITESLAIEYYKM